MQLLRVTKWPTLTLTVFAVLLLFNCAQLHLKHKRDRRRLRSTRPTRWVEFAPAVRNLVDNCPRDQPAKLIEGQCASKPPPEVVSRMRIVMHIETNAHHVWTRTSGLNAHPMRITVLVWTGLKLELRIQHLQLHGWQALCANCGPHGCGIDLLAEGGAKDKIVAFRKIWAVWWFHLALGVTYSSLFILRTFQLWRSSSADGAHLRASVCSIPLLHMHVTIIHYGIICMHSCW